MKIMMVKLRIIVSVILRDLFSSCVISVAFSFRSVLDFLVSFFMMLLALFYSNKHPLVLFINATAKQSLPCHVGSSQNLTRTDNIKVRNPKWFFLGLNKPKSRNRQTAVCLERVSLFRTRLHYFVVCVNYERNEEKKEKYSA